jgi:diguanylate cyclase (GGDEF)-like protein/PAS domain S-box-containing protein
MVLDPRTLGTAFVLLSGMLGMLLLFAWMHNRKARSLVRWAATFSLIAIGIGMANLGRGSPSYLVLFTANALVALAYGLLYAGCRAFNARMTRPPVIIFGAVAWIVAFPVIHETANARLLFLSFIAGGYAALSAWELWRHAPQRLTSQKAAVVLLSALAAFNLVRGLLGLNLSSIIWIDAFANRWSAGMALVLVVYAPALAFVFLSMAKERIEFDYKKAGQALRESEEHYRYLVELSPHIPWAADRHGHVIDASTRWFELTGRPHEKGLDAGWIKALHPDDWALAQRRWMQSVSSGDVFDLDCRVRLADGSYRWFRARAAARRAEDGSVVRWYGTLEDINDQRLAQEQLHWAAYHDDLTGLPNRRLFRERLQQALDQAEQTGDQVGLLILDLDDFKQINDRSGHNAGDRLLRAFGERLARLVPPESIAARLGGDEFAVIVTDISGEAEVVATARAIQTGMREPLRLTTGAQECRTSIGGAISGSSGATAEDLLKRADLALYSCKAAERGAAMMFNPAMREEAQKIASAMEVARNALVLDCIVPFYQPKVALRSGALVGFEALLRWHHPRLGIQSPETLAPAFDDAELGIDLGARMLSRVLADMSRWLDAGLDFGQIAINASSAEFRRGDYAERVLNLLRQTGVPPHRLEIEVTEGVLLDRTVENVERILHNLNAAGVTIALDDFGTGYASLTHLKQFPVDVIKIDRSFTSNMENDADDAAIVKAVLGLSQKLGIEVVAEGVENAAQASLLREYGCDKAQGYHLGRPMPAEDIPQFVAAWPPGLS